MIGRNRTGVMADNLDQKVMLTLAGSWNAEEAGTFARKRLAELEGVSTVAFSRAESLRISVIRT